MLHHVSFGVSNLERSAAFYDAVLSALGYVRVWADSSAVGYGLAQGQDLFAVHRLILRCNRVRRLRNDRESLPAAAG